MQTTIQFRCKNCHAEFEVGSHCAGKRTKCPHCGNVFRVPSESESSFGRTVQEILANLTAEEMVKELHRRGLSAVLFHFDRPHDGRYALHEVAGVSIHCCGSDDMTTEQLQQVVQSFAIVARQHSASQNANNREPYDLKGDKLGMSLDEFKQKYHRVIAGHDQSAPFCSDNRRNLGAVTLLSEKWHEEAQIVNCSIEFPFERTNGKITPTVGGIEMDLLLYKFVDNELFQISGYFDTRSFDSMKSRFQEKYGMPHQVSTKRAVALWSNGISTICLLRGRISPKEWSILNISHDQLLSKAEARSPKPINDL